MLYAVGFSLSLLSPPCELDDGKVKDCPNWLRQPICKVCKDLRVMHSRKESQYCIPETNITCVVNCTGIKIKK